MQSLEWRLVEHYTSTPGYQKSFHQHQLQIMDFSATQALPQKKKNPFDPNQLLLGTIGTTACFYMVPNLGEKWDEL